MEQAQPEASNALCRLRPLYLHHQIEAVMKVPKSTRKAKQSAQKSVSNPQSNKPDNEIAEAFRNLIEAARAEGDDSTLVAVLMPATGLASRPEEKKGLRGLLSPKEILKLQIVELLYGDDLMPESVLEAVHLILANGVRMGDETGQIITGLFNTLLYPDEETRKIIEARMEEEKAQEFPV